MAMRLMNCISSVCHNPVNTRVQEVGQLYIEPSKKVVKKCVGRSGFSFSLSLDKLPMCWTCMEEVGNKYKGCCISSKNIAFDQFKGMHFLF